MSPRTTEPKWMHVAGRLVEVLKAVVAAAAIGAVIVALGLHILLWVFVGSAAMLGILSLSRQNWYHHNPNVPLKRWDDPNDPERGRTFKAWFDATFGDDPKPRS